MRKYTIKNKMDIIKIFLKGVRIFKNTVNKSVRNSQEILHGESDERQSGLYSRIQYYNLHNVILFVTKQY